MAHLNKPIKIDRISVESIRPAFYQFIKTQIPDIKTDDFLTVSEFNYYRQKYISEFFLREIGEHGKLEDIVMSSIKSNEPLASKIEDDKPPHLSQKVADRVASFAGSWKFVLSFSFLFIFWVVANLVILVGNEFDPYPFSLLSLVLSCFVSLQAPLIIMSQNRQEEKDRIRAQKDYMINLKSELEIKVLHEKIDHLMMHQQQELMEMQKQQTELITSILNQVSSQTTSTIEASST